MTIRTEEKNDFVTITVVDDGVGFDTKTIGGNSTGIRSVQTRLAAMCSGTLDVISEIGIGTTATIKIPVERVV